MCPSVTVYYNGLLESPWFGYPHTNVQFQVRFDVNFTDQRVYITGEYWNSSYYNSDRLKFGCDFKILLN